MRNGLLVVLLLLATPVAAQDLHTRVDTALAEAGPGPRFGLVVADEAGQEIIARDPTGRYIPASNTKMFSTAAAFANLTDIDAPDAKGGAAVWMEGKDVVLIGNGDARLSSAKDCTVDCLATLADAIAAKTKRVRDVIGDDTAFPDQRWPQGMSWNNIPTRSGTGISALTLDSNEFHVIARPGRPGEAPNLELSGYYTVENSATTVSGKAADLSFDRLPFERTVRLTGTIGAEADPELVRFGIDDPAHYAAWTLAEMLKARGVKVRGKIVVRHRAAEPNDDPAIRKDTPPVVNAPQPGEIKLTPPPIAEDLKHINKVSQNLHADLVLRRVGLVRGTGSTQDGLAEVRAMLAKAGLPRTAYDFSDGSGMSTYNRISPRGMVTFLRWIAAQPWGVQYRDTLPIGGLDGTLSRRFKGTSLEGKVFAKTGTINATNALSGWMTAKSGKTLTFAFYANDVPEGVSGTKAMDAALVLIAEAN
jgi:D-alanyl-D-alanine carboxypeptidase/D-alanyl-D-alanine-endopeptidase (penicillin-binding protein 4)